MRRRGHRRRPVVPLLLTGLLLGLPALAWTASLTLPVPALGRTSVGYTVYSATKASDEGGVLGAAYTAMLVTAPAAVTQGDGQVRIRAKQPFGLETGWTSCVPQGGTSWRCPYVLVAAGGVPVVTASAAVP